MKNPRLFSRKLRGVIGIVAVAVVGLATLWKAFESPPPLSSPAGDVRPWAEANYQKLCNPIPSPGTPMGASYRAEARASTPSVNLHQYKDVLEVLLPKEEYIPKFEVISFDAETGFTAGAAGGSVRWITAKPYDAPDGNDRYKPIPMSAYHADGRQMTAEEISAEPLLKEDRGAWGMQLNGEIGTGMRARLDFHGFDNLQAKVRDIFDAQTHVSVSRSTSLMKKGNECLLTTCLGVVHDVPLVTVIDLAHGPTQDFTIPVSKGAVIRDPNFTLEVMNVFDSRVDGGANDKSGPARTLKVAHEENSMEKGRKFGVAYYVSPPSMVNAISVDAVDASGNVIENLGRFMEESVPVSNFGAPLSSAVSLRVRYRPNQTRLLLKMKSVPGTQEKNHAASDLFDFKAPEIIIENVFQMRNAISAATQLKHVAGAWHEDKRSQFPMKLTDVSPRDIAARYLNLNPNRSIKIDPKAMTIEFERPPNSYIDKAIQWLKSIF